MASPASTIESLTREFEHALDRSNPSIKSTKSDKSTFQCSDSKSSTLRSGHSLDINQALKGQFVVKPQDIDCLKAQRLSLKDETYVKDTTTITATIPEVVTNNKVQSCSNNNPSPRGSSNRSSVGHYSLGPHR